MCETSRSAPVASRNDGSRAWAWGFVRRSGPARRSALSAGPFVPCPACRTSCAVRRKPRTWSSLGCWGFCSPCTVRTLWPFVASPARCDGGFRRAVRRLRCIYLISCVALPREFRHHRAVLRPGLVESGLLKEPPLALGRPPTVAHVCGPFCV